MPKFSVITINFNNKEGLERTIRSTISQTCKDFEFIVVDGGSTDGSLQVIEKYKNYFSWWCSEPDKDVYNAMNKGARHAHGEYCIFMNSGDYFYDENVLNNVLRTNSSEDFLYGLSTNSTTGKINNVPITNVLKTLFADGINHQATFIKLSILKNYPYDENLKIVSDWKQWIDAIIFGGKTYKNINVIISVREPAGIGNDYKTHDEEKDRTLHELFPDIVIKELKKAYSLYPLADRVLEIKSKHYYVFRILNGCIKVLYRILR